MNKSLKVTIEFEAGSDFQWDLGKDIIRLTSNSVADFLRSRHRENKVVVTTEGIDVESVAEKVAELEAGLQENK